MGYTGACAEGRMVVVEVVDDVVDELLWEMWHGRGKRWVNDLRKPDNDNDHHKHESDQQDDGNN